MERVSANDSERPVISNALFLVPVLTPLRLSALGAGWAVRRIGILGSIGFLRFADRDNLVCTHIVHNLGDAQGPSDLQRDRCLLPDSEMKSRVVA